MTLGVKSSGFLGSSSLGSGRGGGSGSEAAPWSGNFLQHWGNTSGPCVGPLPVSGPSSFAGRPSSHLTAPLMFPVVVLVFGEVSPGAGVGVAGPCPEEGWLLLWLCAALPGEESRLPGSQHRSELLDVAYFIFPLFALHAVVGSFLRAGFFKLFFFASLPCSSHQAESSVPREFCFYKT